MADTQLVAFDDLEDETPDDEWFRELLGAAQRWADAAGTSVDHVDMAGLIANDESADAAGVPEAARRWQVLDRPSAEWALGKLRDAATRQLQLEVEAQTMAAPYTLRIDRIHAWLQGELAPLRVTEAFMGSQLERYAIERRKEDEKRNKTTKLPSGEVRTTSSAPRVVIVDQAAVVQWAERNAPDIVRREPKVLLGDLRQRVSVERLITAARVTLSCGCVHETSSPSGLDLVVGSEYHCETCAEAALLGRVETLAVSYRPVTVTGEPLPLGIGVDVDPGGVDAKVVLT